MVRFAKSRQGTSFVGILKLSVAMIQCIRSSSWTGYMLAKVRHDLLEIGFVKFPRDDRGSVRVFIDLQLPKDFFKKKEKKGSRYSALKDPSLVACSI